MKYTNLEIDKIKPNDFNPNEMPPKTFNHLKREIERIGFVMPLLVRQIDESEFYEIIDGEHRYKVAKELNIKSVPVVVAEKGDKVAEVRETMLATINLRGIQGKFNEVKYAVLLKDLAIDLTPEKLSQFLDVSPGIIQRAEKLLQVDKTVVTNLTMDFNKEYNRVYAFKVVGEQNCQQCSGVLNEMGWNKNKDIAFLVLCQKFLELENTLSELAGDKE